MWDSLSLVSQWCDSQQNQGVCQISLLFYLDCRYSYFRQHCSFLNTFSYILKINIRILTENDFCFQEILSRVKEKMHILPVKSSAIAAASSSLFCWVRKSVRKISAALICDLRLERDMINFTTREPIVRIIDFRSAKVLRAPAVSILKIFVESFESFIRKTDFGHFGQLSMKVH